MPASWFILALSSVALSSAALSLASQTCRPNNPNDELSFTATSPDIVYVREGQFKMLHCCATGYSSIKWFKQFDEGYSEYPWYVDDDNILEQHGNQSLRFMRSRQIKDGGFYKCVARKGSHMIEHVIRLYVVECETKNGRIDITQKQTGPIMAGIGERREITCEGNFGCMSSDAMERTAEWRYKSQDSSSGWVSDSSRYTAYTYSKNNGTIVGNKLVIKSISRDDYHTVYSCILQTPKVGSRTGFDVTIIPLEVDERLYWLILLPAMILVVVPCLVIIYCLYKQRIDYFCRRKCGKLPDRGDFENDLLLLYNDTDEKFVKNQLKPQLKDYKIFDKDCVLLGRREAGKLQDNIEYSYATVLIYTLAFLRDKELCYAFDIAKSAGARIFIVQIEEIPKNFVPKDLDDSILKKAPSIFTNIKWPWKYPENTRKVRNFYCKLKKNLPRKKQFIHQDCESRSSAQPLLESTISTGNEVPEVHHIRPTNILVIPQTTLETQRSKDSGIGSPSNFTPNTEFPDIKPLPGTIDRINIEV